MGDVEHREKSPELTDICVDFDGVIHSYTSGWKGIDVIPDPPVDVAIEALHIYCQHFNVNIYSARSSEPKGIRAMMDYINKWDRQFIDQWDDFDDFPYGLPLRRKLWYPEVKPPSMIYIDDRGFRFEGVFPDVDVIKALSVTWNQRTKEELHAQTDLYYNAPPRKTGEWDLKSGGVTYVEAVGDEFKPLTPDPDKR